MTIQDIIDNPDLLKELRRQMKPPTDNDREERDYYEALGDEIEKHPLGSAGIRRG